MSHQTDANPEEVKHLMKLTFYTQRKQVNQGKNIKYLLEEWPFWFDKFGMVVHFKELARIEIKETFTRNVDLKGKRLLDYMNTVCVNKNKKSLQALTKFKMIRGELSGCSENVKEMVLLQLSYFDEKEDMMFCYVEDTCLTGEVQVDKVHLTPTIVVCGKLKSFLLFSHLRIFLYYFFLFFLSFLSIWTHIYVAQCFCSCKL